MFLISIMLNAYVLILLHQIEEKIIDSENHIKTTGDRTSLIEDRMSVIETKAKRAEKWLLLKGFKLK